MDYYNYVGGKRRRGLKNCVVKCLYPRKRRKSAWNRAVSYYYKELKQGQHGGLSGNRQQDLAKAVRLAQQWYWQQ